MKITSATRYGRQGWLLDNDRLELFLMVGGGHLAGLGLRERPGINPFWIPTWRTIEPWQYRPRLAARYGVQLLSCIAGHNVCLGAFGDPSPAEQRAGLGCHGEAPVVRWRARRRGVSRRQLVFTCACELPIARLRLERTLVLGRDAGLLRVRDTIRNLARCDAPFTMCQHVTFGPPFLSAGATLFDASAGPGRTFPRIFGRPQRLRVNAACRWPAGPGVRGPVNLRVIGRGRHGDFFTNLMTDRPDGRAWFSAVNPGQGLLVAYIWRRSDYPWLGVWDENHARRDAPWNGRTLARGLEFANTPFPVGLRAAADLGRFQGQPTVRWLPARGAAVMEYAILAQAVPASCRGVADIASVPGGFRVLLRDGG